MATTKLLRLWPGLIASHQYSLFLHRAQTMVVMDAGSGHAASGVIVGERRKSFPSEGVNVSHSFGHGFREKRK